MSSFARTKPVRSVRVRQEQLEKLTESERAFLVVICHAYSEINVLGRLAYYSLADNKNVDVLRAAQTHQSLTIIRCLSAKLFEFAKIFKNKKWENESQQIGKIFHFSGDEFSNRKLEQNYTTARNVRDFVTNHYDPSKIRKNFQHLAEGMNFDLFLCEPDANSFSMIGDEISFTGQINREFSSRDLPEGDSGFGLWWKWNLEAWRWARLVHAKTVECLLFDQVDDLEWTDELIEVPLEIIADVGYQLPIFLEGVAK